MRYSYHWIDQMKNKIQWVDFQAWFQWNDWDFSWHESKILVVPDCLIYICCRAWYRSFLHHPTITHLYISVYKTLALLIRIFYGCNSYAQRIWKYRECKTDKSYRGLSARQQWLQCVGNRDKTVLPSASAKASQIIDNSTVFRQFVHANNKESSKVQPLYSQKDSNTGSIDMSWHHHGIVGRSIYTNRFVHYCSSPWLR